MASALAIATRPTAQPQVLRPFPQNTDIASINRYTSAELCQMYIEYIDRKETTMRGYMTAIRRFSSWLSANKITLQTATRTDVIAYRDYLKDSDLKAGTRTQYFRAAKALIHWARKDRREQAQAQGSNRSRRAEDRRQHRTHHHRGQAALCYVCANRG